MKPVVKIEHGPNGWGGPLLVSETDTRTVVASVTGGGIHPLAQRTADLLGVKAVDGFNNKVAPETIIVAFVDCGGTARCGVYPKMGVKTVDVLPIGPSGPLARFINEDNFCSGVTPDKITIAEGEAAMDTEDIEAVTSEVDSAESVQPTTNTKGVMGAITRVGRAVGGVVQTFNQAARNTLDIVIKNIIPFMMFISVIVGSVNYTGIGTILANLVKPLAGSLPGLLCLSIFCGIPFLSPVLGPGAVIAQIIGVILGNEIGKGVLPVAYALPALFAINSQVGCDFIPVALTLAEAEDETTSVGVPAMLFTRLLTGPMAVLIAYVFSFGL